MAPEKGPKRKPTMFPPPPIQTTNAEFEDTASTGHGRTNVRQPGSTVSVSAPEANWALPAVATAPATTTSNVSTAAVIQHAAPTQRNEEGEPPRRRPGRPRKNPVAQSQGVNTTGNQTGEPRKRGRPRKTVPDQSTQNPNESRSRESAQGADTSRDVREVPKKRGPGRPRKAVPDPVSPYEEVYNDEDIDVDYTDEDHGDEDEGFDQNDDLDQVSLQSDEGQETLTRTTRSQASRVSGRTKSPKRSKRSTRREIALRNREEKLENALRRERTRLKARHSFMTKEVYEAPGKPGYAGPNPAFNNEWNAEDEANLIQTYWQGTPLEYLTSLPNLNGQQNVAAVFRASLHVFKVDPLTLFTMGLNDIVLVKDEKSSTMIDGRVYTNPFWSSAFCEKLSRIIHHPLWYGPEPWAFMLFAIKWAAICRTDDRRPLHQDDLLLLERNYCEMRQEPALSYPKIHAKQQRIMTLRGGISSPQAQLLSEIANYATIIGNEPPSEEYYHVVTRDLTAAMHGLDCLRQTWAQDCEFYYQMFAEAHRKELYPLRKEISALYKNCYLSVERKKLYDFKVHRHDLVYFEEHHLRKPSDIPRKLRSSPDREELEEEIPPGPLRQSGTQPDADPFDETAPEAAGVDERVNEDSHDNNPQVIESSDYEDFVDYPGNFSDSDPGEEAEPFGDLNPQIPQETSEQNEVPQDDAEPPAVAFALRPITRLEPCSPTPTSQRNPEEDGAPRNVVHDAQKRKNSGDDPRPRKAIRREEAPHSRPEQTMAEPSSSSPDHPGTVDAEDSQAQPLQSRYDSSGRLILPSLSNWRIGNYPNPAARKKEGNILGNPFS